MNRHKTNFKKGFIHLLLCVLISCGSDQQQREDERDLAIEKANILMTEGNCEDALTVLEAAGHWPYHALYLQTKAAAYACKAGFSELKFWADDLSKISSTNNSFIGSLTKLSTSRMVSSSDSQFLNLQSAIDTLLNAGNTTQPSSNNRLLYFSASEVSDINFQLLMLLMAQYGKFAYYYGNANPTAGVKGTGTPSNGNSNGYINTCLLTYSDATALAAINAGTSGTCIPGANVGHPDFTDNNIPLATRVSRICRGIVLFNNLIDVLGNLVVTSDATINALTTTFVSGFTTLCATINNAAVCSVKSQAECESDLISTTIMGQRYYAVVLENLFP